jgi:hypothetical protein
MFGSNQIDKRHVRRVGIELVNISQIMDSPELDGATMLTQSHSTEVVRQKPLLQSANAESKAGTPSVT